MTGTAAPSALTSRGQTSAPPGSGIQVSWKTVTPSSKRPFVRSIVSERRDGQKQRCFFGSCDGVGQLRWSSSHVTQLCQAFNGSGTGLDTGSAGGAAAAN